jgi:phosphoglycolate phosphatase-like HAD superfamily hydrolase
MAGIDHLFHDIVGDNSSSEPKPNPMTLIKLAQRNNLNLKNCLYIGDSQTDYALAKFAGCNFLGAAWFHNNLTQVTPICYDIKNLITAIESQFQNTIS